MWMRTGDGRWPTISEGDVIYQQPNSDASDPNSSLYTTCTNRWFINHQDEKRYSNMWAVSPNSAADLGPKTSAKRPGDSAILQWDTATGNVMGKLGQFQPERILHVLAKLDLYRYNNQTRSKTKNSFLWTDFFVMTRNFSLNWQKASSQSTSPGSHKVPTPPYHQRCVFWCQSILLDFETQFWAHWRCISLPSGANYFEPLQLQFSTGR